MIAIFLIWAFLSACDINLTGAIPHVCIRKTLGIFPFFFLTFVCWAVAGLSCGRKALQSSLRHVSGWLWDMGSSPLTRAGTWAPAFRAWSLSHWIAREVPRAFFCFFFFFNFYSSCDLYTSSKSRDFHKAPGNKGLPLFPQSSCGSPCRK